ncbi:MAG: 3-dehydroquinate dehydratase [Bacteroidetes bacterium]|nr:3-dehydroquinate dehydratase [Bacteroidota bacterium]MBU1678686.1 3-dehydroquinate dehydratase [Bacteroidota bacterium]MBU2508187.1 3-dehydroquinate dehydratase [Bacteroidota bacterium]
MKVLVLNGPNLNMLGARDKNHYGELSLDSIEILLESEFPEIKFEFTQSNLEGELVEQIQKAPSYFDAIIINPGGYSHTSVAIRDALEICIIPKIEVHLSNLAEREEFRNKSITAAKTMGCISGFKEHSYSAAVYLLVKLLKK